jgi:hypothetical protein
MHDGAEKSIKDLSFKIPSRNTAVKDDPIPGDHGLSDMDIST